MKLFGKSEDKDLLLETPKDTLGFSEELKNSIIQDFLIKKFDFSSLKQIQDIKAQLMKRRILIINAQEILEGGKISILELKKALDDIKTFLRENGGSIGRIGENYLILTPNAQVRISN